jgi:hypothetical protein
MKNPGRGGAPQRTLSTKKHALARLLAGSPDSPLGLFSSFWVLHKTTSLVWLGLMPCVASEGGWVFKSSHLQQNCDMCFLLRFPMRS